MDLAGELDMIVVISCAPGAYLWQDFTRRSPQLTMGVFADHRQTRFDLLQGGQPWLRSSAVIAARFPNVSLNLSLAPAHSEQVATTALCEWLQLVPANKIIAFGGNPRRPVPTIYGHLLVARRVVAGALAQHIERGRMDLTEATQVARDLLLNNATRLYAL
jgi:hypothetical protein